jgi:hypothetical protein
MSASRLVPLLLLLLILLAGLPAVSGEWAGEAVVDTTVVRINFSERLSVTVTNTGPAPLEVVSVALTIDWDNNPTLYRIFEGSAVLPSGGSREFVSPSTRMPDVVPGTYQCFAGVVAKGTDGVAVEHRYPATITADQFSINVLGLPEYVLFPLLLTAISSFLTLVLFRWQRADRWPFLSAVPRWGDQRSRRS